MALGLPVLEVRCGALLFAAGWRRAAALGLAVLSALFTVLLVQAIGRGLNVDCGCFGKWDPAAGHPVVALARDLVFLALAVYCYRNFPREGSAAESVQGAIAREMGGDDGPPGCAAGHPGFSKAMQINEGQLFAMKVWLAAVCSAGLFCGTAS